MFSGKVEKKAGERGGHSYCRETGWGGGCTTSEGMRYTGKNGILPIRKEI